MMLFYSFLSTAFKSQFPQLHQFFQDWYNAVLEPTDESFARLADVIDADFVLISPAGRITERPALLEQLRGNHGNWQNLQPSEKTGGTDLRPRIRIESFKLRRVDGDLAVATYEEWHEVRGKTRGRLSTVVLAPFFPSFAASWSSAAARARPTASPGCTCTRFGCRLPDR